MKGTYFTGRAISASRSVKRPKMIEPMDTVIRIAVKAMSHKPSQGRRRGGVIFPRLHQQKISNRTNLIGFTRKQK
jgi:hypothetical protein